MKRIVKIDLFINEFYLGSCQSVQIMWLLVERKGKGGGLVSRFAMLFFFCAILISISFQGTTIKPLVRFLKIKRKEKQEMTMTCVINDRVSSACLEAPHESLLSTFLFSAYCL